MDNEAPEPEEHGVGLALSSGGPGEPYLQPSITCLCGWSSGRAKSWEEVGRLLDEHLADRA